ncbi:uncharacterized protein LOC110736775 [Chenopodium quinoa]|uniref:uncharacterized protein LOC110682069 n=1 Tax=Chenopodium quinoa TaxID=63459 RepID=UPI000B77EFB4|nr:uncharacterized protein LOC110682069 [Chenopodium quinoa]XP_021718659.1 uncharacterized protein LOC110686369 [Chenopodium quinoa]XP_021720579.1 uncharacterized protein LOC110688179 [Chenopodium quinoa]XP_021732855.1 uncharacterized protein LOC110699653 [Chenopodium quinoa]XP_021743010.1 uncharacterized protein LOC110709103 [Chenopodium quinoa]XP_021746402.1 uncharacterized protein LOC110712245 [Chenopodium quinoa]XP_021770294.1 uncharacterized protein LOC110734446 [Chenopodium quinoa]XP_0
MATRRSISNQSCSSSSIKRMGNSKIRCNCGNEALIKTVRKGPNLGMKFYGCPMWPDTQCDFFKWVNEQAEMEDYEVKLLEKETVIGELQVEQKIAHEKIKKLQLKKGKLEEDIIGLKNEIVVMKIDLMKCGRNEKTLYLALLFSWLLFGVVIFLY